MLPYDLMTRCLSKSRNYTSSGGFCLIFPRNVPGNLLLEPILLGHGLARCLLDYILSSTDLFSSTHFIIGYIGPSPKKPQSYNYSNRIDKLWYLSENLITILHKPLPVKLFSSIEEFSSDFDKKVHYFVKAGEFPDSKFFTYRSSGIS